MRRRSVHALLALTALAAACLALIPGAWSTLAAAAGGDHESVRRALGGLGPFAPLASIGLNVVQGVIAPLPGFVVPFIDGVVFGTWWGALITWVGGIAAASACFAIARIFGQSFATRVCGHNALFRRANATVERHGLAAVALARLVPGLPFDVFSYLGGLTGIRFGPFVLGTAIGSAPHAYVYSVLGAHLAIPLWLGMLIAPAVGLLMVGCHSSVVAIRRRLTPPVAAVPTPA